MFITQPLRLGVKNALMLLELLFLWRHHVEMETSPRGTTDGLI